MMLAADQERQHRRASIEAMPKAKKSGFRH